MLILNGSLDYLFSLFLVKDKELLHAQNVMQNSDGNRNGNKYKLHYRKYNTAFTMLKKWNCE